jgi:hypothetical protein
MKLEFAGRLGVLSDEISCLPTDEPVIPMIRRSARPVMSWKVNSLVPEWDDPVAILVRANGRECLRTIHRRQSLEQLEESLTQLPKRYDRTEWYRTGCVRIDR